MFVHPDGMMVLYLSYIDLTSFRTFTLKWIMCSNFSNFLDRYEGQRDMLYNQTFNLDQVAFAAEGIKDAQQTV